MLCLLLILVCILASHPTVLGARYLKEKMKDMEKQHMWRKNTDSGDDGFVANTNREVPSCPDPLHNR